MSTLLSGEGITLPTLSYYTPLPAFPEVIVTPYTRVTDRSVLYTHLFSDVSTTLSFQFSNDGINWATTDSSAFPPSDVDGVVLLTNVKGIYVRLLLGNDTVGAGTIMHSMTFGAPVNI